MKVVLFGCGNFLKNRKNQFDKVKHLQIIGITDNNVQFWGKYINGIKVIPPNELLSIEFDAIMITSIYTSIIKKQLLNLGIEENKIIFWYDYWSEFVSGTLQMYYPNDKRNVENKNALIITARLDYTGGSLAAVYAGQALQKKNYNITVAAPDGDMKFIQEWVNNGITLAICPAIPYIKDKEIEWVSKFDIVLVNIFSMMPCAELISQFRPVVWWIHESSGNYWLLSSEYNDCTIRDKLLQIQICAVSTIPQTLFHSYMKNRVDAILHYGIPDKGNVQINGKKKNKIVFAIIGSVGAVKGHDIFIEAVKKMDPIKKVNAVFWIIGKNDINEFSQEIVKQSLTEPTIKLLGEKTRQEIESLFIDIDVVVCASRTDSLPIAITEGMMYGKICVTSDSTGTVDYIEDGKNGFIVPHENIDSLRERMEWIIDNQEYLDEIGKRARKTYEKYFTMEQFGTQLEVMFEEAKKKQKNDVSQCL